MKIIWDVKTNLPKVILEQKDILDANHIREMMNGKFLCRKCGTEAENKGWRVLMKYLEAERGKLEAKVKGSIERNTDEGRSRIQIAKLVGFDHMMELPKKLLEQMNNLMADLKPKEEKKNEPTNEYGD